MPGLGALAAASRVAVAVRATWGKRRNRPVGASLLQPPARRALPTPPCPACPGCRCFPRPQGSAKIGMLMAFGGAVGASLAPLISLAADVDPALVLSAALVTVAIFGTFTFIAMLTSDRPMLYLGGMLMSALGWMFFAGMINTLLGARTLFMTVELFFGLFIFCGFVIFDTQVLLARADEKLAAGGRLTTDDAATAAVRLFLDAVNIFVRVLIILIRNSQKKERKERK